MKIVHSTNPVRGDRLFAWSLAGPYHVTMRVPADGLDRPRGLGAFLWGGLSRRLARIGLSNAWGVRGREDLIERMEHLGREGHRVRFRSELDHALALPPAERSASREAWVVQAETGSEAARRSLLLLDLVEAGTPGLRDMPLLAFDAARGILLAREGHGQGWLSEEEVWEYALGVARHAAPLYASWEEYGRDFAIGRLLWAGKPDEYYDRAVKTLLDDAASPWRRAPWGLPEAARSAPTPATDGPVWDPDGSDGPIP